MPRICNSTVQEDVSKELDIQGAVAKVNIVSSVSEITAYRRMPWWLWWNVLSLDAPLVAVSWQWMLATVFDVSVPIGCYLLLWMAVWCVYVADRVLDSFAMDQNATTLTTARHAFYFSHRASMIRLVLPILLVISGWLVLFHAPLVLIERGLVLTFMVGLYLLHYAGYTSRTVYRLGNLLALCFGLWLIWKGPLTATLAVADHLFWRQTFFSGLPVSQILWSAGLALMAIAAWRGWRLRTMRSIPKELLCGLFFSLGCVLGVHYYSLDEVAAPVSLASLLLALMAGLNCIGIACLEQQSDAQTDSLAITQNWPKVSKRYGLILAGSLGFLLALRWQFQAAADQRVLLTGSLLAVTAMAVIHMTSKKLPLELPRVLMDMALLVPPFFVWWMVG